MPGKIDAYVDTVSPYSWFAWTYLTQNRTLLSSHGVEIEYHPFFLGGVNNATGNKPPFMVPAKMAYSPYDGQRAARYFGVEYRSSPPFFPIVSILPQRALTYIKSAFPTPTFESALETFWKALHAEHVDISQPEHLVSVLARIFPESEDVKAIMAAAQTPEIKKKMTETTERAIALGAFGAPFFYVRREGDEEGEPFFGSDRFHYMWDFLCVPVSHLRILEKGEAEERAKLKKEAKAEAKARL